MNITSNSNTAILRLSRQISTLLFCVLESTSTEDTQSLVEMTIEKNEALKLIAMGNDPESYLEPTFDKKRAATYSENNTKTTSSSFKSNISAVFPHRLKQAMKAAGLTQKELAERAGVSQSVVSRLITGKDKSGTRSGVLSHALGVNLDWLHYGTGEMFSSPQGSEV